MRSLLVTQLTPQNDNLTYPNASVNVSLLTSSSCSILRGLTTYNSTLECLLDACGPQQC
jgi:hypothetical protein